MNNTMVRPEAEEALLPGFAKQFQTVPQRRDNSTGLYRQEKLLLRSDHVDRIQAIKKEFLETKSHWQPSMTLADVVNASIAFVLRYVDFAELNSVEELDSYITSRLQRGLPGHGSRQP